MKNCIFCKIARHEIPKEFLYEDDDIMVFPDINPAKEIHLLVVPKKHVEDFMKVTDPKLMAKIIDRIQKVIKSEGLTNKGFKVFLNGGGAQIIDHLHIHVTGPWGKQEKVTI